MSLSVSVSVSKRNPTQTKRAPLRTLEEQAKTLSGNPERFVSTVLIAEATGQTHNRILKAVRAFLAENGIELSRKGVASYCKHTNEQGETHTMFTLSRGLAAKFLAAFNA